MTDYTTSHNNTNHCYWTQKSQWQIQI